jgi:hypothetical protein
VATTRTRATTAKPLNVRQRLFVSEYLKDFNAPGAHRRPDRVDMMPHSLATEFSLDEEIAAWVASTYCARLGSC